MLLSHVYLPSRTIQWIMGCSFPINMWVQRRFFCQGKKVKFCCLKIRDTNPVADDNVNEACEKRCYCLWRLFPPFYFITCQRKEFPVIEFFNSNCQKWAFRTLAFLLRDKWHIVLLIVILHISVENHWYIRRWIFIGWKILTTRPQYLLFANMNLR